MRILILFVVLCTTWQVNAQNLEVRYRPCKPCGTALNDDFTYEEHVVFPTESVISDYGIRETDIAKASVFHQAIDYTVRGKEDAKFAIQAVNGGTITSLSAGDNGGIKFLKAGGYGYGHIFTTNESSNPQRYGKFVLAKLDDYDEWAIIDLEFCRCFAVRNNKPVTVENLDLKFCNKKVFMTTNQVEEGWDIAPLGVSGTKYSHLHLERYVVGSGRKADPNQFVNHDLTDFEVIIKSESSDDNEIKLTYPGTKSTPFRVRAKMIGAQKFSPDGYTNKTMSVDNVAILLERSSISGYEELVGPNYNSRISIGARDDSQITPWNASDFDNRHKYKKFGSWTRTGIKPFAHNDVVTPTNLRNEPYDDYYFADFHSRIHKIDKKKFSDTPNNSRYNDGNYKIKPTVTNVRDELFTKPGIDITIDNFLPFITQFQFKIGNTSQSSVFYDLIRKQSEGNDKDYDDGKILNIRYYNMVNSGNKYFIELNSSEPLSELTFKIKKNGIAHNNYNYALTSDDTKTKWTATIDGTLVLDADDIVDFVVTGKDMSNNKLINIAEITKEEIIKPDGTTDILYNEPGKSIIIPTRKNNERTSTGWKNYPTVVGSDIFRVKMSGCERSGNQEICDAIPSIEANKQLDNCTNVSLYLSNYISGIEVTWTDENDNLISNNPNITVSSPGRYCYKLLGEFGDDCCSKEGCIFVNESDFEDKTITIIPSILPGCGTGSNEWGKISLNDEDFPNNTSYSWSHNSNWTLDFAFLPPGSHSVTVTMPWGCKRSLNFVVENTEDAVQIYEDIVPSDCSQDNGEIHILTQLNNEESEEFEIHWSNGSMEKSLYSLSPGQYCVTVTPIFTNCAIIKCYTVPERSIEIIPYVTPNTECIGQMPNGRIELTIPNGIEPFNVTWSDGSPFELVRENVRVGSYLVTVTDANNCTARQMINVPGTEILTFTGDISQDCQTKLYSIRLSNFPNNFVYIVSLYKWINGVKEFQSYYPASNGYQIVGLDHGKYILETTEFPCKFGSIELDLPEPLNLIDIQTVENLGCVPGEEDGEITMFFEGGMRPLTISVGSHTQVVEGNSATFTNLDGGFYFITFTNPSNCLTLTYSLVSYQILEVNETITDPQGTSNNPPPSNGSIELTITGGSEQYDFEWTKAGVFYSNQKDIFDLMPGNYSVTISDKITGCEIVKNYNLSAEICQRILGLTYYGNNECPPGPNQNIGSCTIGCPKDITIYISSLNPWPTQDFKFPLTITISNSSGYNATQTFNNINNNGGVKAIFLSLPINMDPYEIIVFDACGNSIDKTFYTCSECLPIDQNGVIFSILDNPGTLKFRLRNECEYRRSWFTQDSEIEITDKNIAHSQEYEITWIDGVTKTVIHRVGENTKIKRGKNEFNFKRSDFDGNVKTVTVLRNDACLRSFKFRLGAVKDVVGINGTDLNYDGYHEVVNKICTDCFREEYITNNNSYQYINLCNEKIFKPASLFHYIPNNAIGSNPCIGGTLIRNIASPTGVNINGEEFTFPEYLVRSTFWQPRDAEENEQEWPGEGSAGFSLVNNIDAGGCIYKKEYMFPNSHINHNMYVNWFRLRSWDYINQYSDEGCGKFLNVSRIGNKIEIILDPGSHGEKLIIRKVGIVIKSYVFDQTYYKKKFEFNTEAYGDGEFTFQIINFGSNCDNPIANIGENNCPTQLIIDPNPVDISVPLRIKTSSPIAHTTQGKIFDSENNLIEEFEIFIPAGDNQFSEIIDISDFTDVSGQFSLIITIPGCEEFNKIFIVTGGIIQDLPGDLECDISILDISYDSIQNNFPYFFGNPNIDSLYGETFTFDTLAGYFNEFTRHEIQWDWVKHVRYDSTKTLYYFGTDSNIRSFVTSIDTNGVSNTTWFYDIIFMSCGPLNQQGVWTLIGYKVSEQKYYMYVFDKVNLTALPLIIPNDNRGQTYTTVWNFGPDEYVTKIISGQYEIIKFSSSAYPPFEVSLSRPFKIKTVNKWESNQWLVSGDLEGTMVIAGDTLVSEEWTKSVFIWYDWQGTVVKYKVIESEEERVITHVATDGYQHIFFTGMEIDTVYHENPDSITIETCLFGDTLTVDDFLPSFKQNFNQNTSIASIEKTDGKLRFYPNPFNQGINVQYDSNGEETVLLTCVGMLGNVLFEKQWKVTAGLNEMYLKDFEAVPGGMYSVIVKTSRGDKIHRVIKIE